MQVYRNTDSRLSPYGRLCLIVRDKYGNERRRVVCKVDSLLNRFWGLIYGGMYSTAGINTTMMSGAVAQISPTSSATTDYIGANGGAGHIAGIILGTGSSSVVINNNNLADRITIGEGSGQMTHAANAYSIEPAGCTITRVFENNSGGTINVAEAGIAAWRGTTAANDTANHFLICRDVLLEAVPVENTESVTVVYEMFFNTGNRNFQGIWTILSQRRGVSSTYLYTYHTVLGTTIDRHYLSGCRATSTTGGATRGIRLGTGDTAPTINDINLDSPIAHGTDPGMLLYGASEIDNLFLDIGAGTFNMDIACLVTNSSGSPITIREMGLFGNTSASDPDTMCLLDRFVLPTPLTLEHGEFRNARWMFRYSI